MPHHTSKNGSGAPVPPHREQPIPANLRWPVCVTFAAAILAHVPAPRVFAEVVRQGEVIATALGVFCEDSVIAECVGTASAARRQGAAGAVMRALEAWGAGLGAHTIGLQAVTTNMPAQGLYAALGYVPAGTYHYRFLDDGGSR